MRRIASLIVLAVVVATLSSCSEKQKPTTTGQDQSTNAPQSSTGGNQVAVADAKQVAPDGTKVNEDGEGVQHIDEVEDVKAGIVKQFTVDLEPGRYVLVCNLPGHYKLGMRTGLVVA
jgi:hypothetical protein